MNNIQNAEAKINLSLDEQPDLLDIPNCYEKRGGDTNGKPQIDKTVYLQKAYEFGKNIYLA